jgi:hypothetical protein
MQARTFLTLQKKIYELSPISSLQAINQIIEQYKEICPSESANNQLWFSLYGFLKENPSKELDFLIYSYMFELETQKSFHAKVA